VDEEKLKSYKLKKLKSEFEYLRTVLEECQYIYELSLEKFYQDFTEPLSDEKVQKVKKEDKEQNKKPKEKELNKLYHRIANKTHPDKLLNEDITDDKRKQLESFYKKASVASEKNNYDELVDIAVKLGFDDVYDSEYFLQKSVEKLSDKIKHLQTTYAWIWYHANDETRSNIKGQIIDAYK